MLEVLDVLETLGSLVDSLESHHRTVALIGPSFRDSPSLAKLLHDEEVGVDLDDRLDLGFLVPG